MAKAKVNPETRKAIKDARKMIEDVAANDGNESETRRRVERLFESLMGYDVFKHITRELAVKGSGDTEHCDFGITVSDTEKDRPDILVELKRINVNLGAKHLKQVSSYAINTGCEWIILTNGRHWELHHITFGQPPEYTEIAKWNLIDDEIHDLAESFEMISYKKVKRGGLDKLWDKASLLTGENLLEAIFSEPCIKAIRREVHRDADINVSIDDVVDTLKELLNDSAQKDLANIQILKAPKKTVTRTRKKKSDEGGQDGDIENPTEEASEEMPPEPTEKTVKASCPECKVTVRGKVSRLEKPVRCPKCKNTVQFKVCA